MNTSKISILEIHHYFQVLIKTDTEELHPLH